MEDMWKREQIMKVYTKEQMADLIILLGNIMEAIENNIKTAHHQIKELLENFKKEEN